MKRLLFFGLCVFLWGSFLLPSQAEITVPDWDSPDRWSEEDREFIASLDIGMDAVKTAEMWGFVSGIREYCGQDTNYYLRALGAYFRQALGYKDEQMTMLMLIHGKSGGVKLAMTQEDCDSETASRWFLIQDTAVSAWKDRGLQLPDK